MIRSLAIAILAATAAGAMARGSWIGAQAPPPAWPQWRGPLATGEAPGADPPVDWSETRNVTWKAAIPGMGASTPIIWNDTIYLQTAVAVGEDRGRFGHSLTCRMPLVPTSAICHGFCRAVAEDQLDKLAG